MHRKYYTGIILLVLIAFSAGGFAQIPDTTLSIIANQMELVTEHLDAEVDFSDYTEDFEILLNNPVHLNSGDLDELRRLFFLREIQIRKIFEYYSMYGNIATKYELMAIPGLDSLSISRMMPYISLDAMKKPEKGIRDWLLSGKSTVLMRYQRLIEKPAGYFPVSDSVEPAYKGSPERILMKYAYDARGRIRLGILAEKDPGEQWFGSDNSNGFDFYSAYVFMKDFGFIHKAVIGDYHLRFGQGLTMWSGFSFGKQGFGVPLSKSQGLRPSASSAEYGFLRGIATTIRVSNFEITGFYSAASLDVATDTLESSAFITSIYESGLHRTLKEQAAKNLGSQYLEGGNVTFKGSFFRTGLTLIRSQFDPALSSKPELYRSFVFSGDEFTKIGMDAAIILKNLEIAGEISRSSNGSVAYILRSNWEPDPRFLLWLVYRYYPPDFIRYYSSAFGENGSNANEQGFFAGFRVYPMPRLRLETYVDFFQFPWLKYLVDAPSYGYEYQCLIVWNPSRDIEIQSRWRYADKPRNFLDSPRPLNAVGQYRQHFMRFQVKYSPTDEFDFTTRAEYTARSLQKSPFRDGLMMYQDLVWKPTGFKFALYGRYARFNTWSYDERLYAYEQDVLYSFSIPSYYYNGSRLYLMLRYQALKKLTFWLRASSTIFHDRNETGSGNDLLSGNTKSEIKIQMQLKF